MDAALDKQPHLSSRKHIQLMSVPVPPSYINEYEGGTNAMVTKPHLEEEKLARGADKLQDAAESGKPSKKPRHRHSPTQLAALNELFEKGDHPSLEDRVELAERLGMETKTVNAWFQNKRASTKKRNKGGPSDPLPMAPGDEDAFKASPPSALPSIASLLNNASPVTSTSLNSPRSTQPRSYSSSRRTKRKDLHPRDMIFPNGDGAINHDHNQHDHPREGVLESSFFAGGPQEFFSIQDKFISHNRGPDAEDGAVPSLPNADTTRFPETDSRFVSENDGAADGHSSRKGRAESSRMRTSSKQADELRRAYAANAHPTRDQRQELADRIGMRLQSVTNWFQNQRSQAKKHKDEPRSVPASSPVESDVSGNREHQSFSNDNDGASAPLHWNHPAPPLRGRRPSLTLPGNGLVPLHKSATEPLGRMSLPPSHPLSPRTRRSMTPYARDRHTRSDEPPPYKDSVVENVRAEDILARNRRSRPQPHQLRALKQLLRRTSTPSMEERTTLALEIGMDVGRVTNWFRNVRQTARKRAKQTRDGSSPRNRRREHDSSSGSSACGEEDAMDLDYDDLLDREIDDWSEEECQEAVTPSSGVSQSPPPAKRPRPHIPVHREVESIGVDSMGVGLIEPGAFQELEKAVRSSNVGGASDYTLVPGMNTVTGSGVKIEDALLLLSFHQHVVH
ncbi:hypothetical protein EDD16DRAFT_1521440 [Pisolithus croceorrhizus]|nr:hypothetical protein EDD16DRAFT_1521440 [Pisolithus croceorrhizus]